MKNSQGFRWAIVTFSLGISSGILGHYLPAPGAVAGVFALSVLFSIFGGYVVSSTGDNP